MGRVPYTGTGKMFEGTPINTTNLRDANSIQGAVKGCLTDPSVAFKNFQQLVSVSFLDMFDPKRSTIPVDAVSYRGYPTVTIRLSDLSGIAIGSGTDYFGSISFRLNSNGRSVGYNYQLYIQVFSDIQAQQPDFGQPDLPDTYNEITINVAAGQVLNTQVTLTFGNVEVEFGEANFTVLVNYRDNSFNGSAMVPEKFFFNDQLVSATFGQEVIVVTPQETPPDPYPIQNFVIGINNLDCNDNFEGPFITLWTNGSIINTGTLVSLSSTSMVPIEAFYKVGNFKIQVAESGGISSVVDVVDCEFG